MAHISQIAYESTHLISVDEIVKASPLQGWFAKTPQMQTKLDRMVYLTAQAKLFANNSDQRPRELLGSMGRHGIVNNDGLITSIVEDLWDGLTKSIEERGNAGDVACEALQERSFNLLLLQVRMDDIFRQLWEKIEDSIEKQRLNFDNPYRRMKLLIELKNGLEEKLQAAVMQLIESSVDENLYEDHEKSMLYTQWLGDQLYRLGAEFNQKMIIVCKGKNIAEPSLTDPAKVVLKLSGELLELIGSPERFMENMGLDLSVGRFKKFLFSLSPAGIRLKIQESLRTLATSFAPQANDANGFIIHREQERITRQKEFYALFANSDAIIQDPPEFIKRVAKSNTAAVLNDLNQRKMHAHRMKEQLPADSVDRLIIIETADADSIAAIIDEDFRNTMRQFLVRKQTFRQQYNIAIAQEATRLQSIHEQIQALAVAEEHVIAERLRNKQAEIEKLIVSIEPPQVLNDEDDVDDLFHQYQAFTIADSDMLIDELGD